MKKIDVYVQVRVENEDGSFSVNSMANTFVPPLEAIKFISEQIEKHGNK